MSIPRIDYHQMTDFSKQKVKHCERRELLLALFWFFVAFLVIYELAENLVPLLISTFED